MGQDDSILNFASYLSGPRTARRSATPVANDEQATISCSLLGESPASLQMRAHVQRIAPYFRCLSLTGERACGEEAVARLLHALCPLRELKFVMLDAIEAEERFRSEEIEPRRSEGLLYLPEAEKLSRAAQQGLLRMLRLQAGQSTRIVAFAGRGLKPYISAGYFLPELAMSLGSLRMALPTLRDRAMDIPALIECRAQQEQTARGFPFMPVLLSDEFLEAAKEFMWPGNLAQLDATVEWLLKNRGNVTLQVSDLQAAIEASRDGGRVLNSEARLIKLDRVVQEHVRAVLLACNGNKLKAAEVLGISRSTLYRMLDASDGMDLPMAG